MTRSSFQMFAYTVAIPFFVLLGKVHTMFEPKLEIIESGQDLSIAEMEETIDAVVGGSSSEDQIARLLVGLSAKGVKVTELIGAARSLRKHMTPIRTNRTDLVDTCGTGGDNSGTFNISTAAAFVTAAAGVSVAKHGNRNVSSRSGSANVLAELGVNIEAAVPVVERCLDKLGICFCFAPLLHGALKHVADVRKKLGKATIFNMLGPLVNPAGARYQLLGVGVAEWQPLIAEALSQLGTKRSVIVHGDGLDEVTLSGKTSVIEAKGNWTRQFEWNPSDFGFDPIPLSSLKVKSVEQSAAVIKGVLTGNQGPATDIVVANAAASLWTVGRAETLTECVDLAREAIDIGTANDLLTRLATLSHES